MRSSIESGPTRRSTSSARRRAVLWLVLGALSSVTTLAVAWSLRSSAGALLCQVAFHLGLIASWGVPAVVYTEVRKRGAMNFVQVMLLRLGSLPIFFTLGMLAHLASALVLSWAISAWGSGGIYWVGALLLAVNLLLCAAHWAARAWFQAGRRTP